MATLLLTAAADKAQWGRDDVNEAVHRSHHGRLVALTIATWWALSGRAGRATYHARKKWLRFDHGRPNAAALAPPGSD
ncbi:hypothetical protein APR04_000128 [Promicromonospora umidemergens]|uniref:Uncharacterized protein n=1 Tax=Promicromonospora umidemergens TaxID=629679 RepID=A0ABP8X8L1_9MICO|nr:hypothetical protein [Promicromonospora umidemergens]MCP2281239.1 hypothetical protein [Promicromonospora umidemergens]